jgi:quercetin dioxygenase-like cupin family protein
MDLRRPDLQPYRVDFDSIPWESPLHGVRFKRFEVNGRRLRLVEYTSDFVEPDWCAKGHIGYVLEGRFEIDFDGTTVAFGPGDGIYIPAGAEHKHKAKPLMDLVRVVLVEDA